MGEFIDLICCIYLWMDMLMTWIVLREHTRWFRWMLCPSNDHLGNLHVIPKLLPILRLRLPCNSFYGGVFRVCVPVAIHLCAFFSIANNHLEAIQWLKWVIKWGKKARHIKLWNWFVWMIYKWIPKATTAKWTSRNPLDVVSLSELSVWLSKVSIMQGPVDVCVLVSLGCYKKTSDRVA